MTILESIRGPHDLKALNGGRLGEQADDIGEFLVVAVAGTGSRPGSGPGAVEPSLAPHRASGPPAGRVLRDAGHRSRAHGLPTGRPRNATEHPRNEENGR
ncbi:1-deoxy-D-xylulose-5-phosphate synthase N-terminal domain-containing protein [Streptomyces sp. NPDC092952]|uniref:1-deoxy-D-xylulose-5-phosphate synthase N-terminal domain-containing protein n=1 Tax=Streptomyces sp. NPDC092952 TaxID=3366018 RepID=UPI003811F80F